MEEDTNRFDLCLVGHFLTKKGINTRVMKTKLSDIWRPAMGITIKDITPGLFLFQFYHQDDFDWVRNGGPWSFDNALLVLNVIKTGEDPTKVALVEMDFWIQIYNLPVGYMSEAVGKQLGNFFGTFLEYDAKNNASIWREFMWLKIMVDVRKPLKRKKKICKRDKTEVIVQCKYERLEDFCFICGLLSHSEHFCKQKFEGESPMIREWGTWLRAPPRRNAGGNRSKWLREDGGGGDWSSKSGGDNFAQQDKGGLNSKFMQVGKDKEKVINMTDFSGGKEGGILNSNFEEGNILQNLGKSGNGPTEEEELNGLMFEER